MAVYRQGASIFKSLISQTSLAPRTEIRNIKRWVSPTLRELKKRKDKLGVQPVIPRSAFIEWNYQAELYAFGKRLNEEFNNTILQTALTNRSYIINEESRQKDAGIENPSVNLEDNNTLINEGETFINEYVLEELKSILPKFPSEGIQAVFNHLTSVDSLANVAFHIGLKDLILCAEYPPSNLTLSNSFKAIITALRESTNDTEAKKFLLDFVILKQLVGKDVNSIWHIENPLEMLKNMLEADIEPRLCTHSGGNTILASYQVGLYLENKQCVGLGWGESIDVAIEMAARDGLKRLFGTTEGNPTLHLKKVENISPLLERSVVEN